MSGIIRMAVRQYTAVDILNIDLAGTTNLICSSLCLVHNH
jgi:hypothetical protein